MDRFKPTLICNTSYKILTKILATRMKNLMKHIISESQGGFVVEQQILDNIIIVQEAIHSNLERKQQGMAIKLDMANTFDRVSHFFFFLKLCLVSDFRKGSLDGPKLALIDCGLLC